MPQRHRLQLQSQTHGAESPGPRDQRARQRCSGASSYSYGGTMSDPRSPNGPIEGSGTGETDALAVHAEQSDAAAQTTGPPLPPYAGSQTASPVTQSRPRRPHRVARFAAGGLLIAAAFVGVATGRDLWQSHVSTTAQTQPAGSSQSSGSSGSAIGNTGGSGSNSSSGLPFGNGGGSGSGGSSSAPARPGRAPGRRDFDRHGSRPGTRRHQRHARLSVRSGGCHGHRPELLGPGAHQQPRGRRRDQPQRHRCG